MIARQFDPVAELQSAFTILTKNLTLGAIPLVGCLIAGAIFVAFLFGTGASALIASGLNDPTAWGAMIGGALFTFSIAALAAGIILLISQAAVMAASEAVWEGRPPDIGAGVSRALGRVLDLFLAGLVLCIIAIAISWTFVGPLALIFLMLYVAPAIVVGGESAFSAIGTSWRLSTQNFGPTFAAFGGVVLAGIAGGIVNAVLGHIWIIGWIGILLVGGFVGAYQALVVVRFYDLLKASAPPLASTPPVAYSPPPQPPPPPVAQ